MEINMIYKIGIILMAVDLGWLLFYYFYATVEVYNLKEKEDYQYMGHLWIKRKRGSHYLYIPKEMDLYSYTTEYRIVPGILFYYFNKGEEIRISFHGKYDVFPTVSEAITVKNHIATYPCL
ncbi:MAG: hypothetical protein IKW28_07220 [Lachnospiraceae bacterium]|nr:hypothetical protein [Lachnospiraceae bacterium]